MDFWLFAGKRLEKGTPKGAPNAGVEPKLPAGL